MTTKDFSQISKFLSLILRHAPHTIGLALDPEGWALVDDLIAKSAAAGTPFDRDDLMKVVLSNDKKRFTLSADLRYIRAAQGHSISVNLGLTPREPPNALYHGTAKRFLAAILREGLRPMSRQQVHLSAEDENAQRVGRRHGAPVVLVVQAQRMHAGGFRFYLSENGVWLTDHVPPEFLSQSPNTEDSAMTSRQPKLSK